MSRESGFAPLEPPHMDLRDFLSSPFNLGVDMETELKNFARNNPRNFLDMFGYFDGMLKTDAHFVSECIYCSAIPLRARLDNTDSLNQICRLMLDSLNHGGTDLPEYIHNKED